MYIALVRNLEKTHGMTISSVVPGAEDSGMKRSKIEIAALRNALDYDSETGVFTWKKPESNRVGIGERAGRVSSNGRRMIGVFGEVISSHRLAWFYTHGEWPDGNVSQINGNYDDARLANLKLEQAGETARKGKLRITNESGLQGVSWSKGKQRWLATITRDYRRYHLGYFDTKEDAAAAYLAAVKELPDKPGNQLAIQRRSASHRRLWKLWRGILKESGATSGWATFADFAAEVGERPTEQHHLVPVDTSRPVCSGNAAWLSRPAPVGSRWRREKMQSDHTRLSDRELRRHFGITKADYDKVLAVQNGVCAICNRPERDMRNGKVKALAVDHDHRTGMIRGLLCAHCNQALGKMGDDPALLRAAADYIERYRKEGEVVPSRTKESA